MYIKLTIKKAIKTVLLACPVPIFSQLTHSLSTMIYIGTYTYLKSLTMSKGKQRNAQMLHLTLISISINKILNSSH